MSTQKVSTDLANLASQAEAEAGAVNTRFMTPLRVAQAIAALGGGGVPSGTREDFQQTSAPTGWTKETGAAYNDAAPRCITGSVGPTGGTVAFSTLFGRTSTDSFTLTSPATIPSHGHPAPASSPASTGAMSPNYPRGGGPSVSPPINPLSTGGAPPSPANIAHTHPVTVTTTVTIGATGSGGGHSHDIDCRVKFVDFTIAVKD
jgi:hypothetical protein